MNEKKVKKDASRRFKFNAVDIVIILLVALLGIGIFLRYDMENRIFEGEGEVYTVEFVCEKVRYTTADYINVGDVLYFTGSTGVVGTVQGTLVSRPSSEEVVVDGKIITAYYPQDTLIDITGTISVSGTMTENGFLVSGNTYIAPNSLIEVSGKYADFELKILSLKKAESDQ